MSLEFQLDVVQRLSRIEEKVSLVPDLAERVESLESSRSWVKGVISALSALWVITTGLLYVRKS